MTTDNVNGNVQPASKHPIGEVFLEFMEVLLYWRKFIVRFVFAATVITIVVVLFLPKWYKATATVLPAEQTNILGSLEGVSSLVKSVSSGKGLSSALGGQSETQRYTAILKSERMLTAVIDSFDLMQEYDIHPASREDAMKTLMSNLLVDVTDEGNLSVSVFDKDPVKAAQMANYFINNLNAINAEISAQNSKAYRMFIEMQYRQALLSLTSAEEAMKDFQQKHGVLAVPEQMEAAIKTSAELYGMLALREVEAGVLERSVSGDNPMLLQKRDEIAEMKKKLDEMRRGTSRDSSQMKIFLPLNQTPELGTQYIRYLRDLKTQSKIVEFITPLYEQAKMEEKRNTPTVMVLDKAVPPERKAKPRISMYALMALVLSSLVALGVVFTAEMVKRLSTISSDSMRSLWRISRNEWFGLRPSKKNAR